jgi:hypothetical protein
VNDPLAALADIELPDPPAAWMPEWLMLVIAIAAAAVVVLGLAAHRRGARKAAASAPPPAPARAEARRRLDRLRRDWQAGGIDDREAAYRLCALLRIGLGLPQLDPASPPRSAEPAEWAGMMAELRRLRYRPAERGLEARLFDRAAEWLAAPEVRAHG